MGIIIGLLPFNTDKFKTLHAHFQNYFAHFLFSFNVFFTLAPFELIQRRLGNIDKPPIDKRAHLPVKQCQQKGADMGSVHIGIAHNNDFMIAQLLHIEVVPHPGPKGRNDGSDLFIAQDLVKAGFLYV